ncbi:IclR family transcriptional regulator [Spiractinospora alimapuensis]|uniref:IclR family transcriptional regulator n=1 Tax=Spiractinospora alimapuensis TaxID=2820884 RepID=UPI001F3B8802|nr:IclR family transcriptional regulator [Spiractinospora alimapuensis]QVQ50257.1 IclR family transcriptional regulator [Spiractinospora alimapuensis]
MGGTQSPSGVRDVKSAARTVELLELLAARENRPTTLRELSESLDAPRSSVYALVRTLIDRGWVRADASGTRYSIGIRTLLAGTTYLDTDERLRLVRPHLHTLNADLDETIHFGRLNRGDIVYLATKESTRYLRPYSRVGRRLPAYSTAMGKALLADRAGPNLDENLPRAAVALTPNTRVSHEDLLRELESVRELGYAVDHEENSVGVACVAVALRYTSPAVDAISCSLPASTLTAERMNELVTSLIRVRHGIEDVVSRTRPPGPESSTSQAG